MAKSFNQRMKERFVRITSSYQKANEYVHETAMMIVKHAKEHGDCSTAQGLVMALPASMRREMLILWFGTFTPIVVKNSDDWDAKMHKEGTKLFVDWNLEKAEETPFYELAEQNKERPPLDLEGLIKMFTQFGDRIEKLIDEDKVPEELVESAYAAAKRIKAIKIVPKAPANDSDKEQGAKAA